MITAAQRKEIALYWDSDLKFHLKKLQRIYNSTVTREERDTDCLCKRAGRKIWVKWFKDWARENKLHD